MIKSISVSTRFIFVFVTAVLVLSAIGCSQSVDSVDINSRHPKKVFASPVVNGDSQGSNSVAPASASFIMGDQSAGGNSVRTQSTSTSFIMTGGIGVD